MSADVMEIVEVVMKADLMVLWTVLLTVRLMVAKKETTMAA